MPSKLRLLIVGAGAVGSYFGGRLLAAGADVTFLVRSARAEQLARQGLIIHSPYGNVALQPNIRTRSTLREHYDLVLIACKSYHLTLAMQDLTLALGSQTLVLPLLNGITHLAALDQHVGKDRVLGGLCQIGVTLSPDGIVQHLNDLHTVLFGARAPAQVQRLTAIAQVFQSANFTSQLSDQIEQALWDKFVFITVLAGITTLMRGALNDILATPQGKSWIEELLSVCCAIAAASGHPLAPPLVARLTADLTNPESTWTSSMLRDIWRGAPTEAEHIIGAMVSYSRATAIHAPLLELVQTHLQVYELQRRLQDSKS